MKDDIRKETCCIIRRNGEYLVGKIVYFNELKWSIYRNDAWRTRDPDAARRIARRTGGTIVLFNPIVNQERIL